MSFSNSTSERFALSAAIEILIISSFTKVAEGPHTNADSQKAYLISLRYIQKLYPPMLSLKRIRKTVNHNVHIIKAGNKILVNLEALEISNPDIKTI